MGTVTATVLVEDGGGTPVDGVTVRVFLSDGVTFVTQGNTGNPTPGSGEVEFSLNGTGGGTDYLLRFSRTGYYFPGGASQTISVTDPPSPDNDFGPYVIATGPTEQLVSLVAQDTVPDPLSGVRMRIYDDMDAFVTEAETDGTGTVQLFLEGAASPGKTYAVHLQKDGVIFIDPAQSIAVLDPVTPPDTNIFDFEGVPTTPGVSADPDLCRVYGTMTDLCLGGVNGATIEFSPIASFPTIGQNDARLSGRILGVFNAIPALVRGKILARGKKVKTDSTGYFQVDLPRGGCYAVHIHGLEDPIEITEYIYVPDQATIELTDLLYPYVTSFAFDTNPVSVAVGATLEVGFTMVLSNGQTIEDLSGIESFLEFTVTDTTLASTSVFSASSVSVEGVLAGVTQVTVARNLTNLVTSRPAIASLVVTPLDLTVT